MPVFKLCLKIIRKNLPSMSIYIVVLLVVSTLVTLNAAPKQQPDFSQAKADIALIAGESSPLIDGFKEELSKTANFVDIPDETEKLQDALYFRSVTYILRIPEGFTRDFIQGGDMQLQKTIVPNSIDNAYIDLSINQYWNTARLYIKNQPGITQEDLVRHLKEDLAVSTPVDLKAKSKVSSSQDPISFYFNYLSYALAAVLILGISSILLAFRNRDLSRRNFCSPIRANDFNFQLGLACLLFAAVSWAIAAGLCFVLDFKNSLNENMLYFLLNSFVFTFCLASVSYLIGNLLKDRNAMAAVCNVVALGPCFISGVFVPQEFLNDTVLRIASFTPTYWYVKANLGISSLTRFDFSSLSSIYSCILIELGFAVAFFAVSMVIGKRNRLRN